jgi:hypothetical protein
MARPTGTEAGMGDIREPGSAAGGSWGGVSGAGAASSMDGASEYGDEEAVAASTSGRTAPIPTLARTIAIPVQARARPGRGATGAR